MLSDKCLEGLLGGRIICAALLTHKRVVLLGGRTAGSAPPVGGRRPRGRRVCRFVRAPGRREGATSRRRIARRRHQSARRHQAGGLGSSSGELTGGAPRIAIGPAGLVSVTPAAACEFDGAPFGCPWTLAEPHLDVAVDLLDPAPQLLDPVHRVLDPPGQLAHLGFEPIHAQFGIDRRSPLERTGIWLEPPPR